ncbi:MAG: Lrp/AsnC family transcriptional regulator, partial [Pseudomonadota bacterium]
GYRAVIDRSKLDGGLKVYVAVDLLRHSRDALIAFERSMQAIPQVRECHNVSGSVAYILLVEVPDLAAYKRLHTDVLGTIEQMASITSYFVLDSPKNERG